MHKKSTPHQSRLQPAEKVGVPSAATLFRAKIVDEMSYNLVRRATDRLKPILWLRDGVAVKKIQAAGTPHELLALVPLAAGLGEHAWHDRMRQFDATALPLIGQALKEASKTKDQDVPLQTQERLITELRWRGEAGAQVLLDCFTSLDDYGKSLASVVLGLLGKREASGRIWNYYQKAMRDRRESHFVGALWGLIDLKDTRAASALFELLVELRDFYELYGFLSLAGDARAVIPLLTQVNSLPEGEKGDPFMAVVSIAHRLGRQALLAELGRSPAPEGAGEQVTSVVEMILSRSPGEAQEWFSLFYRGFKPDDVPGTFGEMGM